MLINEKYTGSVMLQKTFIEDYFSCKQKKNTGQLERYLVENSHPAIISREVFESVQDMTQNYIFKGDNTICQKLK